MPTLTVRNLDEDTHRRLRLRAAGKGTSMEAEARTILAEAVRRTAPSEKKIAAAVERLRRRIRTANNGAMPKGVVDDLIAERRDTASRGG